MGCTPAADPGAGPGADPGVGLCSSAGAAVAEGETKLEVSDTPPLASLPSDAADAPFDAAVDSADAASSSARI